MPLSDNMLISTNASDSNIIRTTLLLYQFKEEHMITPHIGVRYHDDGVRALSHDLSPDQVGLHLETRMKLGHMIAYVYVNFENV